MPKPIEPAEAAETTELMTQQGGDLATVESALANIDDQFTHDDAQDLQDESAFLPYMRLIQGDNNKYKEPPYDMTDGDFSLHPNKTDANNLGKELDIMFVTWRPLAMDFTSGKPRGTTDRHSEEFKEWRQRSESKNENIRSGFQWGYEALCWLPDLGIFATFWLNTASLRRFARYELIGTKTQAPLLRQKLTIWAERIVDEQEKKTYRYWVIKHAPCNTPFASMPDMETLNSVVHNFKDGRQLAQGGEGADGVVEDTEGEGGTEVAR